MIKISNKCILDAVEKIYACEKLTAYTRADLDDMIRSALYILRKINEINNKTVVTTDLCNKEIELEINIDEIRFHHNMLMVYAERAVQKYVREHVQSQITDFNDKLKDWTGTAEKPEKIDIRITGNGYGNATVYNY